MRLQWSEIKFFDRRMSLSKFTRETLDSAQQVQIVDRLDDLVMYCYDADSDLDQADHLIRQSRGLVFHGEKLLVKTFPYTPMYLGVTHGIYLRHFEKVTVDGGKPAFQILPKTEFNYLQANWGKLIFYPAQEGTLIRAFAVNGKWYFATHRRLDSKRCFWGGKISFGELFALALKKLFNSEKTNEEILSELSSHLDQSKVYVFLLKPTIQTRIVSFPDEKEPVILVGVFENNVFQKDFESIPGIPSVKQLTGFRDIFDLYKRVEGMAPEYYQGVLIMTPKGECIKICSYQYLHRYLLRGNVDSIKLRYLQILSHPHLIECFRQMYPEKEADFDEYEDIIDGIAQTLADNYNRRYGTERKEYVILEPVEHHFLVGVRATYNYSNIDPAVMREYLIRDMKVSDLNKMIHDDLHLRRDIEKIIDADD